jgi:hypothetical protein
MDIMELEDVVKNCDLRLSRVEHILPTLATKEDLKAFATKEDLKAFATKEELRTELRKESELIRQQFNAVAERIEGYVRIVAEGHGVLQQRLDETNRKFEHAIARLDRRVIRLEGH